MCPALSFSRYVKIFHLKYSVAVYVYIILIFTALHGMQTRSSDDNSVFLSFCQTRELWQNGRKICPDFYTMMKEQLA